ncbi:unnamed protein product [Spirodela intermedia]|uniref:Uncharacterized protein n=1 Tax=Spirodela intermedia TaxID=51605 RepID=A0A7I8JK18_SPIIN|nr:unnamed protein product [Spirodela intermedia]CAA6670478.1 unnamed protein product [Spirodela intermedia]
MSAPVMDNSSTTRSREVAQRLFQTNLELEEARRKAVKLKIPSDQNAWSQMRDNFETIILEDHDFSEKHGVEYSLWQLHHRKIDEYRAHLSAASTAAQGGKVPSRPDRTKKIFSSFKSFLSEASGFYHDLILKIRAKYGLPLGYFSEGPENQAILSKDIKKSSDTKKALISCHRCLIFLGDLARYKGMYGEGDSASRDYAAASSYYMQAASLWPSSGNPHHQLAILSICTDENELTTIYRYFRSLAVENPLLTARDNLIVAFEKNRQKCSQLPANPKTNPLKIRMTGRGRGYTGVLAKNLGVPEIFNAFCIRFVRLNGILYTRTSLETFGEIFSSAVNDLTELLSSGPDEGLNFGTDAADNGMFLLKLVAILIFSVYNVSRESESQSYAEILQRSVLLQNAFTAAFEFMGSILKRCTELHDATSSYLLPTILVFIEWLACHPDIASGVEVEEKQASARSIFWSYFVSLMNRLLLSGLVASGGEEDACFFDMSRYDEGETENRLALWEDFELRGFVPLAPAQLILNFSGKHSYVSDGSSKEKKSRIQRILGAGKALTSVVSVDQKKIYFDSKMKKYILGDHLPSHEDEFQASYSNFSKPNSITSVEDYPLDNNVIAGGIQSKAQLCSEGEEDEVIVFKPTVAEKPSNGLKSSVHDVVQPFQVSSPMVSSRSAFPASSYIHSTPVNTVQQPVLPASESSVYMNPLRVSALQQPLQSVSVANSTASILQQPLQHVNPTSKWVMNQETFFSDGLQNMRITDDGLGSQRGMWGGLSAIHLVSNQTKAAETIIPSNLDAFLAAAASSDGLALSSSSTLPVNSWKAPVGRPVRRLGPPPGFNAVPSKQKLEDAISSSVSKDQSALVDDYSWLDGYSSANNGVDELSFSGKQVPLLPAQVESNNTWDDYRLIPHLKQGNQEPGPVLDQAQSLWPNYYVAKNLSGDWLVAWCLLMSSASIFQSFQYSPISFLFSRLNKCCGLLAGFSLQNITSATVL